MTNQQFREAVELARSDSPLNADTDHLHGCALPGFQQVVTTVPAVAGLLRWQCSMFNGEWDHDEMNDLHRIARRKFLVM